MKLKKIAATALTAVLLLSMCACERGNMIDKYYDYDVTQYINLGQYENLVLKYSSPEATDAEVEQVVNSFLNKHATWIDTDRTEVQEGDKVTINYIGYIKGVTYDGMQEDDAEFEVGSETYYKDFEQALIGKKVANSKYDDFWVEVDFPSDYSSGGLAGKNVEYSVLIKKIQEKVLPEFTDELVNEKTEGEYTTAQSYREYIEKTITEKKQKIIDDAFAGNVWSTVISNAEVISYPEDRMAYYEEETTSYLKSTWKDSFSGEYEHFIEVYLGIDYETYLEQLRTKCEKLVKEELVLVAIAREKGMTIEWSDYKQRARNYLETYDCTSIHELEKVISRGEICLTILNEDVNSLVLETAKIELKSE